MTARRWYWLIGFAVLGTVDLISTVHAHDTWRPGATGPSVMPLGQLLGWVSSVVLLLITAALLLSAVRRLRMNRRQQPRRHRS